MSSGPPIACSLSAEELANQNEATPPSRGGRFVGVAGVLMALCCLAGPTILGAAAGAAIGNVLGIAAAVLIALMTVLLVRRWRAGSDKAC